MNNKWKRSESASNIPRLLRNYQITSPCDSISRSPSPVKSNSNSRLPTPIQSHSRENEININNQKFPIMDNFDLVDDFGPALEEIDFEEPSEDLLSVYPPLNPNINATRIKKQVDDLIDSPNNISTVNASKKNITKNQMLGSSESIISEHLLVEDNIQIKKEISEKLNEQTPPSSLSTKSFTKIKTKSLEHLQNTKTNTMYISPGLITKVSKKQDLKQITDLNLSLSRSWNRKIQFIENLDGLSNLQSLNLSNNNIQKIQNLAPLLNLKSINLSSNQITSLNGIEDLPNLQFLNVNHNKIPLIPKWFSTKMSVLRSLKIANNQISQLGEVKKLAPLTNLHELDYTNNPIIELPQHESMTIFYIKSLNTLNGIQITVSKRNEAITRYEQVEVDRLTGELRKLRNDLKMMNSEKEKLLAEKSMLEKKETSLNEKLNELKKSLRASNEEMQAQLDMNKSKSKELSRLCEKQFKLEQELAFYKLDAKFDEFWLAPNDDTFEKNGKDNSESPYIGKSIYRTDGKEKSIDLNTEQSKRFADFLQRLDIDKLKSNMVVFDALENVFKNMKLEKEETDKSIELKKMQNKLDELEGQLKQEKLLHEESKDLLEVKQKEQEKMEKEFNNKLAAVESLYDEMAKLKISYDHLSADHTKCLSFLQSVLQYLSHGTNCIKELETMNDKSMQSVLLNLKSYIIDMRNSIVSSQDVISKSFQEKSRLTDVVDELKDELADERRRINILKNDIDQKDSNERVLKHELATIKASQLKDKNDASLHEYDVLCDEMKLRIQQLNKQISKQKEKLKSQTIQLKCLSTDKNHVEHALEESKKEYDEHCLIMNEEMEKVNALNDELVLALEESKKDAMNWQNEATKIKEQATYILDQGADKSNEMFKYLHGDLSNVKELLSQLKQEHEKKLDTLNTYNTRVYQLMGRLVKQIKNLKDDKNGHQHDEKLFVEIQNIQKCLKDVMDQATKNIVSKELYGNILDSIDKIEKDMNQEKERTGKEVVDIDVLLNSFEKVSEIKENLNKDSSTYNQEEAMLNLSSQVKRLENKLLFLQRNKLDDFTTTGNATQPHPQNSTANYNPMILQPQSYQHYSPLQEHQTGDHTNVPNIETPVETFHHHFFNHTDEDHDTRNDQTDAENKNFTLFCNIKEHSLFDSKQHSKQKFFSNADVNQFDQSREDLRWELNRLENKVGNAVLHRSLLRHSTRLFEKSLI